MVKDLKTYDLALDLVDRTPRHPKTLTRAARDYLDKDPVFVLGCAMAALRWLSAGWSYDVFSPDVLEARDCAMDSAKMLNNADGVNDQIRQLVESNESAPMQFVGQSLPGRLRTPSALVNEMSGGES